MKRRSVLFCFFMIFLFTSLVVQGGGYSNVFCPVENDIKLDNDTVLKVLNGKLHQALAYDKSFDEKKEIVDEIEKAMADGTIKDSLSLADAHYLTGVYYLYYTKYQTALDRLFLAARIKENLGSIDDRYGNCLSNISVGYYKIGDFSEALVFGMKALKIKRTVCGNDSSSFAPTYLNLASTYLEMNALEKAIEISETGLKISDNYPDRVTLTNKAAFYHDIGISLARKSEYTKALYYFKEALTLYEKDPTQTGESKQLLLIVIAQLYRNINDPVKAEEYYRKALSYISEEHLSDNFLVFISYAGFLAENGRLDEGIALFDSGLSMVKKVFGSGSREYCLMLSSNASFIYKATGDGAKAVNFYRQCMPYIDSHQGDYQLRNSVSLDYAHTLMQVREYGEALKVLDDLSGVGKTAQPVITDEQGKAEKVPLSANQLKTVLSLKYEALNALASESGNKTYTIQAIETGKSLITLFDQLRSQMSEEESRNFLSATARDYYTGLIENYADLFSESNDPALLSEAFEYCERSKLATFLVSMREVNASRFSLPPDLVSLDIDIQKRIGEYRELITNESDKAKSDSLKITTWETKIFTLLRSRDSLIRIFEEKYPAYYSLKYKNNITPAQRVPKIIGRESNLVSYVLTESKLYIFVINSRNKQIITSEVDSMFYVHLNRFRSLLSEMPDKNSARESFNEYMDIGLELYKKLFDPVVPYLKGDKVVISPDNILSYIPFETLITEHFRDDELLYREAPFALKKYRFSYIYSVTLSSETMIRSRRMRNSLVAFAPSYDDMDLPDSLLNIYPNLRGGISKLPYAAAEATDAVDQCGGKVFLNKEATEDAYKKNAAGFSIIHLAMHTLLNDQHPAYSKMIFAGEDKRPEDGFLNAYEVYNIPLNAMMVVLSSCNTGSGVMITGEGILSLARGFLFAGSQSVVMSMWEVEDFTGSEVVKSFYRFIRHGQQKSMALRNARLNFLKDADQVRSHPYYWATLVVYGDDTPLYFNKARLMSGVLLLLVACAALAVLTYKVPRS